MMRAFSLALVSLALGLFVACSDDEAEPPAPEPNLLFIVIDTFRADHVSVFGDRADTPNIAALAKTGVSFSRAYSHAGGTGPSHTSMFTSLFPEDHGVHRNSQALRKKLVTLAEILSEKRTTAGIPSLGVLGGRFGFNQGFDEYFDNFEVGWWKQADEINALALPWLREHADEPFFLWVHYSDPHHPYAPPVGDFPEVKASCDGKVLDTFPADGAPFFLDIASLGPGRHDVEFSRAAPAKAAAAESRPIRLNNFGVVGGATEIRKGRTRYPLLRENESSLTITVEIGAKAERPRIKFRPHVATLSPEDMRAGYAGEAEYVDAAVGKLLATVDELGIREHTMIVLTADHGEELGDYTSYFGHGRHLYEAEANIPLIMSFPGHLPAGERVDLPVRHVDIMPTVLELFDIDMPANRRGISLLPLDEIEPGRPVITQISHQGKNAILFGDYRYILATKTGAEQLFRVSEAPKNIITAEPAMAKAARAALERVLADRSVTKIAPKDVKLTPEEIEQLRALGYTE